MCESDPELEEPLCVQWCLADALTYEEKEEDVEEEDEDEKREEMEIGLEALAKEHGLEKIVDALARMAEEKEQKH
jgi:benzoyl-CoA reductase subunit BamC